MKNKKSYKLVIILLSLCLLSIPTVHGALQGNISKSVVDEEKIENAGDSSYYSNSLILVFGKCDNVVGPLVWLLGFYCPLIKRNFRMFTNDERNETLSAIILGPGKFGTYLFQENINIDISGARGVLFYFKKSILVNGNNIIAFCKAENIWVNTY
jgi:hypothetical protein